MNFKLELRPFSLNVMSIFYIFGGINHFLNPQFYLPLIPSWLPFHEAINIISGIAEITFGLLLHFPYLRKWASYGIVLMLVAFIPSHVFFIQQGSCLGELCVSPFIAWIRLIVIHPLLILWALYHRK